MIRSIFLAIAALVFAWPPAIAPAAPTEQWYLSFLRVDLAQTISQGDGVVVGVIDSGVDATHPDLQGSVLSGADFLTPTLSTDGTVDGFGHGTAMAGIVSAHGRVLGIAPKAKVLPIRVIDNSDLSSPDLVAEGIDFAVGRGASIINISISAGIGSSAEEAAVKRALAHNVVVVAAAGNTFDGFTSITYPAADPGVVSVVGVDHSGNHSVLSASGPQAVLAAPAVDIYSTYSHPGSNSKYATGIGTSASSAIVSGVVALIRSKFPKLSAAEVVHRLTATADDKGAPGRDPIYGYGIVDPVKALTADVPPLTQSATPEPTQPPQAAQPNKFEPLVVVALVIFALAVIAAAAVFVRQRARA